MYTPEHFAQHDEAELRALIREYPLGLLITHSGAGLQASHVPMILDGARLRGHLARANPQWSHLTAGPVLAVFSGPEHYVTPSWYPSKLESGKVVPTWNYVAVHVTGRARLVEDRDELLALLRDLTDRSESAFEQPWRVTDAPPDYIENLTRAIAGFEIAVDRMEGKWKLSQNRPEADRAGVVRGLESLNHPRATELRKRMK